MEGLNLLSPGQQVIPPSLGLESGKMTCFGAVVRGSRLDFSFIGKNV